MLKLQNKFYTNNYQFNKNYNFYFFLKKHKLWFFVINVIGRIFLWVKKNYYMQFTLSISTKPLLFYNTELIAILDKKKCFFINTNQISYNTILTQLYKINKPSIFNKRGFIIKTKVCYKKKGKISSYVTNK